MTCQHVNSKPYWYKAGHILCLSDCHVIIVCYQPKQRSTGILSSIIIHSGKVCGKIFGKFTFLSIWRKKVWQINRSANRLLIVSTTLDGFSLVNHRRFTKFTKLSPCQTFPLYSSQCLIFPSLSHIINYN